MSHVILPLVDVYVFSHIVALLSLIAAAGAVVALVYRLVPGSAARSLGVPAIWLSWLVAVTATAGSLAYSQIYDLQPCLFCWIQRIAMYPLCVILLVGAVKKDRSSWQYGIGFSLFGLAVASYHYLVQVFPSLDAGACDPTNRCSARLVEIFGFVSIPFMAGAGFLLISVLLLFYVRVPASEVPTESSKQASTV